jgi:hypothetical protein
MIAKLLVLLWAGVAQTGGTVPEPGSIAGTVVNSSQADRPVGGVPVVLRVQIDGQFVVAAETVTDEQGRFLFDGLPAVPDYVYLPGANWQTVHYPARRIRLGSPSRDVDARIEVRDVIQAPSPLVVRDHEIIIEPTAGALRVTESLLIDNPTLATYVGQPRGESSRAATLTLSIPTDFTRVTFQKEFFGRRFTTIDGKLVTDIPWEPGTRPLEFTYLLPNTQRRRDWERPLDLCTQNLRVTVRRTNGKEARCNLNPASADEQDATAFASHDLPEGFVLRVELGRLPVSFMTFAPWIALAMIAGLAVATLFSLRRYSQRPQTTEMNNDQAAMNTSSPDLRCRRTWGRGGETMGSTARR